MKNKQQQHHQHPDTYNGVVLGALMVLIGLVWFTVPFLLYGKVTIYPWIVVLWGIITVARHVHARK